MNTLYFGDNLDVLQKHVADSSVDLIYLDPPFNSKAAYNVLYQSPTGGDAQTRAFDDTWRWDQSAEMAMAELSQRDVATFNVLRAFQASLGQGDMMAYLAMMGIRLSELRRVLKPTGSLYLHCDPTASHYLKILLDVIFRPTCFRNEIIWKRTTAHSGSKKFSPVHDTILYYSKSSSPIWNDMRTGYAQEYLDKYYRFDDGDGRLYWRDNLCAAGIRNGDSGKHWRGLDVAAKGMHWKFRVQRLDELDAEGRIYWPAKPGGMPQYKRYRDELKGLAVSDVWDDIDRINPVGDERLGYPTQKPLALLERIIRASSREGDVILDPFCGCGTAIHAAERLGRSWVGIDVTYLAIQVIEDRLKTWLPAAQYKIAGIPSDELSARKLAQQDPHTFQQWAVGRVGGQSRGRGADRGIDGEIAFAVGVSDYRRAIISVKGGQHVGPDVVRSLKGVVQREGADMGIFICLDAPTREMRAEAATAGLIDLPSGTRSRLQIVTAKDLIEGPNLGIVHLNTVTGARAARAETRRKPPKVPTPEELRREPRLPPMGIAGGGRKAQGALPLDEPILAAQPPAKGRRHTS
jgi:DNA modification methylase